MNISYRPRPKLDRWLRDRALDDRAAGSLFGCSHEYVRRMRLPFDDARRAVPGKTIMSRIIAATEGDVVANDFFPEVASVAGMAS
jgi:hypothetical protein